MKTSGNVLGIQAKQTLKRIGETWKAVVRQGEASAHIQIIGDSQKGIAAIFTKQEHVLTEERVKREIPEPNWQDSKVPLLAGMIHTGTLLHGYRTVQGGVQQVKRQLLYRASASGGSKQRATGNALQTARKPFQRQRYTRSSLSPPDQEAEHVQREQQRMPKGATPTRDRTLCYVCSSGDLRYNKT